MPELRKDPIVGRWVIIAHERAKRPHDFKAEAPPPEPPAVCPFCEGHEDKTPPEILAYRDFGSRPNGPGWRIRVVPNRFPALKIEGNLNKRGDGIYDVMDGIGAHEVIIESPVAPQEHGHALPEDNIREVLWVYRDRLVDLKKDTPAGPRHALQERRRRRRGQPRAHAQPVDRHPDRADLGLGRDDRIARVLQLSRPLHLLRHGPAGARRREADRAAIRPTSPPSARSPAGFRSRPGSCPRPTPATSRTSPSRAWTTSARCSIKS